jgi:hypothetical protein
MYTSPLHASLAVLASSTLAVHHTSTVSIRISFEAFTLTIRFRMEWMVIQLLMELVVVVKVVRASLGLPCPGMIGKSVFKDGVC